MATAYSNPSMHSSIYLPSGQLICWKFTLKSTWLDTTNPWTNLNPVEMRAERTFFWNNSLLKNSLS
jgi:hypothetical protein